MKAGNGTRRFWYCTRCGDLSQTWSSDKEGFRPNSDSFEDRCCSEPKSSCTYIELVPKRNRKKR